MPFFAAPALELRPTAIEILYHRAGEDGTRLVSESPCPTTRTGDGYFVDWRPVTDLSGREVGTPSELREPQPSTRTNTDEDLRLSMLARKYARTAFSREDEARLAIVSERLRKTLSRIDASDVAELDVATDAVGRITEFREALETKYGI